MKALNGKDIQGRTIVVSEARPLEARPPRRDFDRRDDNRRSY
jgi:hypothetical protein